MRSDNIIKFLFLFLLISLGSASFAQQPGAPTGTVRLPSPPQAPETVVEETAPPALEPAEEGPAPVTPVEPPGPEMVYLNVQDQDIKDVIRQISKATGKNFIIDDKVRGKITILSEKMLTKEEAYQAFLSALEVSGFTVVTGPAGIIKIVSLKDAMGSPIPIHVDSTPFTDSFITRLINLENISAVDMSNAIKGLISKDGNLFAYPATNTLIITDSGTNIDRLMKIIKELDQEGPQQVVEIVPIRYADAQKVASTVLNLFELEKTTAAARRVPTRRGQPVAEEVEEVSKIIADDRTNSVIILASKRSVEQIKQLIAKLDTQIGGETGTVHVHYLKFAKAEDLAQTLSSIMSATKGAAAAAKPAEKGKAAAPAIATMEGGITIGADKTTNALIITASPKDYQMLVDELISKLDVPRRQVYLESIIMELTLRKEGNYGLSGYAGGGNGTILGFGQTFGAAGNLFSPESLFTAGGLLGGVLGRDSISIDVPVSGGGTQTITMPAFSAFLNLVQTYSDANVVSTPNILTLDNEEASIDVKRKEYAASTTTTSTGVIQTTPTPLEAGLTLKITPQISEGDAVRLKIEHELSNFEPAPKGAVASPQRSRKISTSVMAMDGQTVVLGGLMEDVITHSKRKIPILGDIPIIGLLFSQSDSSKFKTNLLVFITPHVIKDPSDFSEVMQRKINQRNKFIEDNYGKKQEREIKKVIAAHRADLLEFTMPPSPATAPMPQAGEAAVAPARPAEDRRSPDVSRATEYTESSADKPVVGPGTIQEQPVYESAPPARPPATRTLDDMDLAY